MAEEFATVGFVVVGKGSDRKTIAPGVVVDPDDVGGRFEYLLASGSIARKGERVAAGGSSKSTGKAPSGALEPLSEGGQARLKSEKRGAAK